MKQGELEIVLDSRLDSPSRLLLRSYDAWLGCESQASEKTAVLHALRDALSESASSRTPRVQSIPRLIEVDDPGALMGATKKVEAAFVSSDLRELLR